MAAEEAYRKWDNVRVGPCLNAERLAFHGGYGIGKAEGRREGYAEALKELEAEIEKVRVEWPSVAMNRDDAYFDVLAIVREKREAVRAPESEGE